MSRPSSHRHSPPSPPPDADRRHARPRYVLDREAVRSVDHAATVEYGIPGIVLMENAARALAAEALAMLGGGSHRDGRVLIICGSGNNGGDGWALARHLRNAGAKPLVAALGEPRTGTDAETNRAISRRMEIEEIDIGTIDAIDAINAIEAVERVDLVVDAIFGTGLDRPVRGTAASVIEWINACGHPVLAVDISSGMDCDTGQALGVMVKATRTVSFVGHKPAFGELNAQAWIGEVVIGDIGAPATLTKRFGRVLPDEPSGAGRS